MRKLIGVSILLLLVIGCAAPHEYKKGDEFLSQGDYIEALKNYELALKKSQTKSDREMILTAIASTKTKITNDTLNKASRTCSQSIPPTIQSFDHAISILEKGLQYDDTLKRISSKIDEYSSEKKKVLLEVQTLIDDADNLISNKEHYKALIELQKAQRIDVTNRQLTDKTNNLIAYIEDHKKNYLNQINVLMSKGQGEKAKETFDKLVLIAPQHKGLEALQIEIDNVCIKELLAKISLLESQEKYYSAYKTLTASRYDGLDKQILRITRKGEKYYYSKAKAHLASGKIHQAYIDSVKAKELSPNDIRVFQIHKKCEDLIQKEIQKYIAILSFDGPVNDPDAGKLFSGALISRLFKALPYGINIVEREKIEMLMNEKQMKLQNIGGLLGVDMIITGNVSLFKADKTVSEAMASAKIKIGEEEKPNPEFTQMLKVYGKDLDNWPHRPPMTCKEDKFEIVKYKKGRVCSKAFGNVSLRIFDARKAAIVYAKDFKDSIEKADTFQEPIETANILEDPLEIPTDTEIKGELRDKMVNSLVDVILTIFENREKRFLQWATLHINRKEYHEAVKYIAQGYLYCNKSKKGNQFSEKIYDLMINLTESS
jgi:tetratricopeptide (TPR) repeat protein